MPARKKPERQLSIGDRVKINLHSGRLVDATIKAVVIDPDGGTRYQVDFDQDRTAFIRSWQVVEE
jgi:Mechanosensitive ion channel, beta-domain